jgi:hypothetical protein
MPTVLWIGPYRFSFFSLDCAEPRHVHVVRERMSLKVWLDPVKADRNEGFKSVEIRKIIRLVSENRAFLIGKWNEFCNG